MSKNTVKIRLKYFTHSHNYHRFIILKEIQKKGSLLLPIQSNNEEFLNAISNIHIQSFISEGLITKNITGKRTSLILTEAGVKRLRKHYIDYQLDILALENNVGDFYSQLIEQLIREKVHSIALYGASDTSRSFINYLQNKNIITVCIIDDDLKKQGFEFLQLPVISPAQISKFHIDAIVISTIEYQDNILENIKTRFKGQYKILTLFN